MTSITPAGAGRRRSPVVRVGGALVSWTLFAMCFTLLALGALQVMVANGGFCASGGPYEIAEGHECSAAVVAVVPLSIFGLIAAVGLSIALAGGFGLPLVAWSWPILFVGLGIIFLVAAVPTGAWAFWMCAVLFIAMGLVPLVLSLRAAWREMLVGTQDALGRRFAESKQFAMGTMSYRRAPVDGADTDPLDPGDVLLAWVVSAGGAVLGIWLAWLVWSALS